MIKQKSSANCKKDFKLEPDIICLGKYQILPSVLGTGGWGKVWKGIQLADGVFVAVKRVQLGQVPSESLEGIMNEINMLKHLSHPNIVKYLDSEKRERELCIVLELVESGSLADIARIGTFPEQLIVIYLSQILEGLEYLHSQGVIHQDIKGANILLTKTGQVKLADFGIAIKTHQVNPENFVLGTPYWMAPEIVNLMGASTKSDIWSLGCTVVELLTGKPPYFDLPPMAAMFRIGQDDTPPLPDGISAACRDFLLKCFQKEPFFRHSAAHLLKHPWIIKYSKRKQVLKEEDMNDDVKNVVRRYGTLRQNTKAKATTLLRESSKKRQNNTGGGEGRSTLESLFSPNTGSPAGGGKRKLKRRGPEKEADKEPDEKKDPNPNPNPNPNPQPTTESPDKIQRALTWQQRKSQDPTEVKRILKVEGPKTASDLFDTSDLSKFVEDDSADEDWDEFDASDNKVQKSVLLKKLEKLKGSNNQQDNHPHVIDIAEFDSEIDDFEDWDRTIQKNLTLEIVDNILKDLNEFSPSLSMRLLENTAMNLMDQFESFSEQRLVILREQGALPLMDMLSRFEKDHNGLVWALRIINKFIEEESDIQEGFGIVGGIPAVLKYANEQYSKLNGVHLEVARFIQNILFDEQRMIKMFFAAQGLQVLVTLLQSSEPATFQIAIDSIEKILNTKLNLRLHIPKNDFCRVWVRCDILHHLLSKAKFLSSSAAAAGGVGGGSSEKQLLKIAMFLFTFSRADRVVKQYFTSAILNETLDLLKNQTSPEIVLLILKTYGNLTSEGTVVTNFINEEELIKTLVLMLGDKKLNQTHVHYLVLSLSNICCCDAKSRLLAAQCGIIPHLKLSVANAIEKKKLGNKETQNDKIKQPIEYILPIMFEFTHTASVYPLLLQNNCIPFYISLFELGFPYATQAVDALANWLERSNNEPKVVEELSKPLHVSKIVKLFETADNETFEGIIEPLHRISQSSKKITKSLISEDFLSAVIKHLSHEKPLVRVNLMKILSTLYSTTKKQKQLITKYKLHDLLSTLEKDSSVIVSDLASRLKQRVNDTHTPTKQT